jgi:hypothetical protein
MNRRAYYGKAKVDDAESSGSTGTRTQDQRIKNPLL